MYIYVYIYVYIYIHIYMYTVYTTVYRYLTNMANVNLQRESCLSE